MSLLFSRTQRRAPISAVIYAMLILVVTILVLLLLAFGQYRNKHIVQGVVRKGEFHQINSSLSGSITRLYVREGDVVKAGEPIFELAGINGDTLDNGKSIKLEQIRILDEYLREIREVRSGSLSASPTLDKNFQQSSQANSLGREHIQDAIAATNHIHTLIAGKLRSTENLEGVGAVRSTEVAEAKRELLQSKVAIDQISQTLASLHQQKNDLNLRHWSLKREGVQNVLKLDEQIAQLEQQLMTIKSSVSTTVSAQHDGIIDAIFLRPGDPYPAGSSLGVLRRPEQKNLLFVLDVPASVIGFVDPGQELIVRVTTFPYEYYGILNARIISMPETVRLNPGMKENAAYQIKARLLPRPSDRIPPMALKDGMNISAYVSQPPLSLFEWLFMPFKLAYLRNPQH